jgi:sugar O-acyltransferase (sialic acid O-acetyltransferase NeuD family)
MFKPQPPSLSKTICIAGTGGCGREALWLLCDVLNTSVEALVNAGQVLFLDDNPPSAEMMGVPVITRNNFDPKLHQVVLGIGMPTSRRRFVESLPPATTFTTLVHPTALLSPWVEVGEGSLIAARCIVTTHVKLGRYTHLNIQSTISHDFAGGDYFTTAPMASVSGNCTFGEGVYLGSHATVKQGISICDGAVIGMGAAVVKPITEPGTYVGVPATKKI